MVSPVRSVRRLRNRNDNRYLGQVAAAIQHRSTRQSGAVTGALRAAGGFRSAQELYAALRGQGERVGLSTVYRHLQALADLGVVDVIHTPEGESTYRYCGEARQAHHHHLVCRECGRAEEINGRTIEQWASKIAEKFGYTDVDHTVEVFGVCAACSR
jgi:Fur family transcriptional regulator, ferric uptake regulator